MVEKEMFSVPLMKRVRFRSSEGRYYIRRCHRWKRVFYDKLNLVTINGAKERCILRNKGDKSGSRQAAIRLKLIIEIEVKKFEGIIYDLKVKTDISGRRKVVLVIFNKNGQLYNRKNGFEFHIGDKFRVILEGSNSRTREGLYNALHHAIGVFRQNEIREELMIRFIEVRRSRENTLYVRGEKELFYCKDRSIIVEQFNEYNGDVDSNWEIRFDESKTYLPYFYRDFGEYNAVAQDVCKKFGLPVVKYHEDEKVGMIIFGKYHE